jgi:pimeloyl-ACP methyl ester carboxylesterase
MNENTLYRSDAGRREVMAFYDGALASWPLPHDDPMVKTRYGDTFVIASGEKSSPALVLLHGASSNAVSWVGEVETYAQRFRVYAVDIIGSRAGALRRVRHGMGRLIQSGCRTCWMG